MKTLPNLLVAFLLNLLFVYPVFAQNGSYPVLSMYVESLPIANDTTPDGLPLLNDSTIFNLQMHISVFDTTNIEKIYVNLGDGGQTNNRLQHIFDWDVSGVTGNGTSYSRDAYNITLELGNFMGLLNYQSDIILKRTDGTYTDSVNFSR